MIRRQRNITSAIALALALTASLAPAAWADPAPLAKAEATIAANSQSNTSVRPNPDEQTATGAPANPGPCSEVCSGGAGSYGSASQRSWTPDRSGATLPHDPRPRSVALASNSSGSLNAATATPASPVPCGDVCSAGYPGLGTPATVVRTVAPGGGFDWGDAGIGAGATIVLMLIGTGGALATTNRRGRRAHQEQVSANS